MMNLARIHGCRLAPAVTSAAVVVLIASLVATPPVRAWAQTPPLTCKPWGSKPSLGTQCTLAHDDTVKGHSLPAGTQLHYDTTGALDFFVLVAPARVDGLELQGSPTGPFHFLYANGMPRQFWLSRIQDVQGVPCRPLSFWAEVFRRTSSVRFHPNGRLASCGLGRAATIQGRAFGKGDVVRLDASGMLAPSDR